MAVYPTTLAELKAFGVADLPTVPVVGSIWTRRTVSSLTVAEQAAKAVDTTEVVFLASTSTAFVWVRDLSRGVLASWFMTAAASATTNGAAFVRLVRVAEALGRPAVIDGGRGTTYTIDLGAITAITLTTHDLRLEGDGALIRHAAAGLGLSGILQFVAPTTATGVTLTANAALDAKTLTISSAAGISIGDVIVLETATSVSSLYGNYHKRATSVVTGLSGNALTIRDVLPFPFTTAETSITTYAPRALRTNGLRWTYADDYGRFDLVGLIGSVFVGLEMHRTTFPVMGGVIGVLLLRCVDTTFRDLRTERHLYAIAPAHASLNTLVDGWIARDCYHPFDPQTWARKSVVKHFTFANAATGIQCHPAFDVQFIDGDTEDEGNTQLRAVGARVERVKIRNKAGVPSVAAQTGLVGPLAGFEDLRTRNVRTWIDVEAPHTSVNAGDGRVEIKDCTFWSSDIDGHSHNVSAIKADGLAFLNPAGGGYRRNVITQAAPVVDFGVLAVESVSEGVTAQAIRYRARPDFGTPYGRGRATLLSAYTPIAAESSPLTRTVRIYGAIGASLFHARRSGLWTVSAQAEAPRGSVSARYRWSYAAGAVILDTTPIDDGAAGTLTATIGTVTANHGTTPDTYWIQFVVTIGPAGAFTLNSLELEFTDDAGPF